MTGVKVAYLDVLADAPRSRRAACAAMRRFSCFPCQTSPKEIRKKKKKAQK